VLAQEHRVYPLAVRWFVEGRLRRVGGKVLLDAAQDSAAALISPLVQIPR
jgi:phosphoribosylglycinamide formyltransferase-1